MGLNTALQSLSFVVPMVAIPVANNQPGVARPSNLEWQMVGGVVKTRQGGLAEHSQQSVARGA
ncbi:hypothetical protein [Cyanobium sp. A2C-AMD]|uniref:hypothetical protein n=1 Tax=Cyanobium sp. A2C-AMD TaxID=2823695 RepID=UPI0020CBD217|nr:hypothetical protein [Cyanobium sp. A2C-AMD]MCP9877831.1 hypothetical protein [Cyanobium sp. A2C-AMD]